jgi:threonine 3-dehydrogenase
MGRIGPDQQRRRVVKGADDLAEAVRTAVINKRAGGMGLISGRKAFQRPMAEGVELLNAIQDVYLGRPVTFLYPSSIAAYGLPDLATKSRVQRVREDDFNQPSTMYGCNKLYAEHLGRYYSRHYKQLSSEAVSGRVDFRCVRFPGLISAVTVPSGGTSDYAPEMIHAAAEGNPYACFVREDTRIPFMAMPDGVEALLRLAAAPAGSLTRQVYNVGAFAPSAGEIRGLVATAFPAADITFEPDVKRQGIVDSWPGDVDDTAARRDWGFAPKYGLEAAFADYLIPTIRDRYRKA